MCKSIIHWLYLARRAIEAYVRESTVLDPGRADAGYGTAGRDVCLFARRAGPTAGLHRHLCAGQDNVALEVIHNAISAATRDPRFPPVRSRELADLDVKVDVLSTPEPVSGPQELDPRRYGVIVQAERAGAGGCCCPTWRAWTRSRSRSASAGSRPASAQRKRIELLRFEVERYT